MKPTGQSNHDQGPWLLDPETDYLNHGSFGSCPRPVLAHQQQLREEMERRPMEWFIRRLPELLGRARERLGDFLGAAPQNLAFVPNATYGVNCVLRSLDFRPGDELLITDHEYNACANAARFVAERGGAKLLVARLPFPLESEGQLLDGILGRVTEKTRLVLVDHVTSQTALVLPVEKLVAELGSRGVDVLIDGAHAPGMLELRLDELGAAYYTGNLHKWLCAPKGAAFLHVRPDRQELIHPLSISHGHNAPPDDRLRLHRLFDWTGTVDFSPFLCLEKCIELLSGLCSGGLAGLRKRNHELAVEARRLLLEALELPEPCPEGMLGSMASLPLPDASGPPPSSPLYSDQLQQALRERHRIEAPVIPWPRHPQRLLRISCQAYNHIDQYRRLAQALRQELVL